MNIRNVEELNVDLGAMFGWRVEVAEQRTEYEAPGYHLKLYRMASPPRPGGKDLYLGPMPIYIPDYAINNAGWLCGTYYELGYEHGRRDERRRKRGVSRKR